MLPKDKNAIDDRMLVAYLLGKLPDDDAERLDELSVADDAIASRLNEVENALVDAHVNGELPPEDEAPFQSFYLASPLRREKVEFAQALSAAASPAAVRAVERRGRSVSQPRARSAGPSPNWFSAPSFAFQWGLALAALVIAAVAGYLFFQNRELSARVAGLSAQESALESREKDLQAQLDAQPAVSQPPTIAKSPSDSDKSAITVLAAVLLMPQTRGSGQPVAILADKSIATLPIELALEASGFTRLQATLKDPGTNQTLWTSGNLAVKRGPNLITALVNIPSKLLRQQNYVIEVNGISASGAPDLVGAYTFHAVLR
jgi:hypothetical protein